MSGDTCGSDTATVSESASSAGKKSVDEEIKEIQNRHRAIARYRVYLIDPMKPRKQQKTEVERGLTYDEAKQREGELNAVLKAEGKNRFMDPSYGVEMTNAWDAMSEYARQRMIALGKTEKDFRR